MLQTWETSMYVKYFELLCECQIQLNIPLGQREEGGSADNP